VSTPLLTDRGISAQAAAAARLGLNQPKVSALRNYKLEGFSVERLMTLLNALDQDVEIVIRAKPRSRGHLGLLSLRRSALKPAISRCTGNERPLPPAGGSHGTCPGSETAIRTLNRVSGISTSGKRATSG